jgi:hypothetical protein
VRIPKKNIRAWSSAVSLLCIAVRLEAGVNLVASFSHTSDNLIPYYGYSVSNAGDVNGDGFDDFIVGAYGAGSAYLYLGSASINTGGQMFKEPDVVLTVQQPEFFGCSVAAAGDVNNDGYDDVIVGAYQYNNRTGRAYLYFGGSTLDTTPDVVFTGKGMNSQFGSSVSGAGDVNHDGYGDIIIGAQEENGSKGAAYIYFGGAPMNTVADVTIRGTADYDWVGSSVSTAGDVNNDGYDDVIVGMSGFDYSHERVCLYMGGSDMDNIADVTLIGEGTWQFFGQSVSTAGDVNGDGYDDVIVGAECHDSRTGRAYIYYGGSPMDGITNLILTGENANDNFGHCVSEAGDVNGDGFSDVIVSANGFNQNTGRVYVYLGAPAMDNIADLTLDGEDRWNYFGSSVSKAGDVNNDGYEDVLVGAYQAYFYAGRSYIYLGGASLSNYWKIRMSGFSIYNFGRKVTTAGDVNGDGFEDILVSESVNNSNTGRVYLFFGGPSMDNSHRLDLTGAGDADMYGCSIAAAGDVNGDGYDDVIVGAMGYDDHGGRACIYLGGAAMDNIADIILTGDGVYKEFACSVSSAGDVNNDGYDDVLVGAKNYQIPGRTGRAYIYFGGPVMDNAPDVVMTGEGTLNDFGNCVSRAGDVNGDGYDDVLIGAKAYNENRVRAYLFFGGSPMDNAADVTMTGTRDYFGCSVTAAGDVNGDGYDDVIVGEAGSFFTYGWGLYFFFGGPLMDSTADFVMNGWDATTCGDVNNDGYDDVIISVSSPKVAEAGYVRIFYGSRSMDYNGDVNLIGEGGYDDFGASVSTAGDVNGDGITEWIIGAPQAGSGKSGKVYLYQLSTRARTHAWLEGPYQPEGNMAQSLFSIGAIPLTSPYSDSRKVKAVPNNAVDWVQLELRGSAAGPALSSKSVFINTSGDLVEPDGTTTDVTLPALDGSYYVVLRHRNHLAAMSPSALTFSTSPPALFDFSTGLGQYYGTDPNRAVQLGTGVYGMPAGDADGSGSVDASDRSSTWNERNQSGYSGADCNLSGTVDASDRSVSWNNRNRSTAVP